MRWTVDGLPASFATRSERPWKETLRHGITSPLPGTSHQGLTVSFRLPPEAPLKDIDNLCDPLFAVVVNRVGWFARRRPNIRWWLATREINATTGCTIELIDGTAPLLPATDPLFDGVFCGPLPKNARDTSCATWVMRQRKPTTSSTPGYMVCLQFADVAVNLGDIATGPVKSLIDCLYPVLGGRPGAPEDWRVQALQVEKGVELAPGSVRIRIWPN